MIVGTHGHMKPMPCAKAGSSTGKFGISRYVKTGTSR